MDLNKTYCASDCRNYKCNLMLSYSIARAAEARKISIQHEYFSDSCMDKINPLNCWEGGTRDQCDCPDCSGSCIVDYKGE